MGKKNTNRKEKKDKVISIRVSNAIYDILEQVAFLTKDRYIESKKPVNAVVEDLIMQRIYPLLIRNAIKKKIKLDKQSLEFIKTCILNDDLTEIYIISEIKTGIAELEAYQERYLKIREIINNAIAEYENIFDVDFLRISPVQKKEDS
ncbi:MAG: hypothetical protein JXJ04_19270 [Spirochaetales bacterium]|nr:hypothetical protein [Spirochaetales bacterium]